MTTTTTTLQQAYMKDAMLPAFAEQYGFTLGGHSGKQLKLTDDVTAILTYHRGGCGMQIYVYGYKFKFTAKDDRIAALLQLAVSKAEEIKIREAEQAKNDAEKTAADNNYRKLLRVALGHAETEPCSTDRIVTTDMAASRTRESRQIVRVLINTPKDIEKRASFMGELDRRLARVLRDLECEYAGY